MGGVIGTVSRDVADQTYDGPPPAGSAVPQLSVRLLGGFRVERSGSGGPVIGWQRRSAKTLVKLLAATPDHLLHREQVLDVLWPGADTQPALNSFGKALHAARRAFEPELPRRKESAYLLLEDGMVVLNTDHAVVDADRFAQLANHALHRREISAYESALTAYGGELLPEDRYADWCAGLRSLYAELQVRLLEGLAEALEERGAYAGSADRIREVLQHDPTREVAHRHLMRLYQRMGVPDQAVRQFRRCEDVLRRELDLAPQQETVSLYRDVLSCQIQPSGAVPESSREPDGHHQPSSGPAASPPFVGREGIVRHLCKQLTCRDEEKPGLILVSGETGVGKTRLLEEFTARARRQGAVVLWGGGGAHGRQFTCGPFAVALERYSASRPEAEREELARRYPAVARFVPSLGLASETLGLQAEPLDYQPDLAPAVVRLLTDLAARQPVVLAIGDVHDIDPLSLDLLRYLAHLAAWRPWLIAATAREEEILAGTELWRTVDSLMREHLCAKIVLPSLSRRDCDDLVRAVLPGGDTSERLLDEIYLQTRGNPLLVKELTREMRKRSQFVPAQGAPQESAAAAAPVPARVRALTADRMAAMDEPLRCVLRLAAATDRAEISVSKLRAGAAAFRPAICDSVFFDALDRAVQSRFLEEREGGYVFRHELVRAAVLEDLSRHHQEHLRAALAAFDDTSTPRLTVATAG